MAAGEKAVEPRRIRGSYRRRLLDLLSDGPLTVSEAGRLVGLRLPHVSAELKKLRAEGLVHSDSEPGQRGAKQHLTAAGWQALSSDELSRLTSLSEIQRPPAAIAQLLAKDGPQVLLAYTKELDETMIPLPVDSHLTTTPLEADYSGKRGVVQEWVWAVARESEVRWYALDTLERVSQPKQVGEQTMLSDWSSQGEHIGLVRARLLDPRQQLRLPVGTWFAEPSEGEWPPLPMPLGSSLDWSLGTVHSAVPPLSSKSPILSVIPDRLATTTLLNHSIAESMIIGEASLVGLDGSPVPLDALTHWIGRAHPRLSASERKVRLLGLLEAIRKGKRTTSGSSRVEESTWRRFLSDWPRRQWSEEEPLIGSVIDVAGLSHAAWLSLVDWSVERGEEIPVVIQYPPLKEPEPHVHSVLDDSRVRLLILDREVTQEIAWPTIRSDPLRGPSWFRLKLAGDVELPCHLYSTPHSQQHSPPLDWSPPRNSSELAMVRDSLGDHLTGPAATDVGPESSIDTRIYAAVVLSERGDSEWADKMESHDALAAWLATPKVERWSRWRRIGQQLGPDWIGLMEPADVDIENLSAVAASASPKWQDAARRHLGDRLRSEHDLGLRLWATAESGGANSPGTSWLTSVLLTEVAWVGEEIAADLARRSTTVIENHPPDAIVESLNGIHWMEKQNLLAADWSERLAGCQTSSEQFRGWQSLRRLVGGELTLSIVQIVEILTLPLDWWAVVGADLFLRLVDTPEGRAVLLDRDLAWTPALLREVNEPHEIPGVGVVEHLGCPSSLKVALDRFISHIDADEEHLGTDCLSDLHNSLTAVAEGDAPPPGVTHPLIGWLAQPLERWPDFSPAELSRGCPEAMVRLAKRRSGFHDGLVQSVQRRL